MLPASGVPRDPLPEADEATGSGWTPPPARTPSAHGSPPSDPTDVPWAGIFDEVSDDPPRPARRWLLGAALAPWAVLAAILLTRPAGPEASAAGPTVDGPPPTERATPSEPSTTTAPTPVPSVAPAPLPDAASAEPDEPTEAAIDLQERLGAPTASEAGRAIGAAVVAARSWLGGPTPGVEGRRYVEHLVVESTDRILADLAVVTVRAVVLPVVGDTYGAAVVTRVAVPVAVRDGTVTVAGTPWRLDSGVPETPAATPTTTPVEDADLGLAAVDALQAAGYQDVTVTALGRTSEGVYVADVAAMAPGTDVTAAHVVWLVQDLGRLRVAGGATGPGTSVEVSP